MDPRDGRRERVLGPSLHGLKDRGEKDNLVHCVLARNVRVVR